ncbi:hypothetical protein RHIZ404_80003 [Rhizobium sp. EC-SD404]|nr:hypothetical protein RHIZ404_80003 [Rhizobium sp. EC-SD404]
MALDLFSHYRRTRVDGGRDSAWIALQGVATAFWNKTVSPNFDSNTSVWVAASFSDTRLS